MPTLRHRLETRLLHTLLGLPPRVQQRLAGAPIVLDGQRLAPEAQLTLRLRQLTREPLVEDLPVAQGRAAMLRQTRLVGGRQPIGALRDLTVDGPAGPLPARLYLPTSRLADDASPLLVFFHGGGYLYGDIASHDAPCRLLAERSGVKVLSVDYRLAPEHPFPAAVEDAIASVRWVVAHAEELGADPSRLAVGGDSAGGNLAAVTAIAAAEEGIDLAFQLLVYPVADFSRRTRSRELFNDGFYLSEKFMVGAHTAYLSGETAESDVADVRASPLLRTSFPDRLAPALVITAGFDPLRDEGEAYARLLADHGVSVLEHRFGSMIHSFFNCVGCGHEAPAYVARIADWLGEALGERSTGRHA